MILSTEYAAWDKFCKKSSYGNDEENFLRICLLLGNPVRKAVLHQFKIIFKKLGLEFDVAGEKESLKKVLDKYRFTILQKMAERKIINNFHQNLMFPVNGKYSALQSFSTVFGIVKTHYNSTFSQTLKIINQSNA